MNPGSILRSLMRHSRRSMGVSRPAAFYPRVLYAALILVGWGAALGPELCLPDCRDNGAPGRQCETVQVIVDEGMVACGPRHAWQVVGWLNIQQSYRDRDSGRTLLHYAAAGNWPALTRALLVLGANRNARTVMEATPLHYARGDRSWGVAAALLAHGADPNARNFLGKTPLHQTGHFNGATVAETLLAHGADPQARDIDGRTPLHTAALLRSADVAAVLLAHGADPQARDIYGQTPLHIAAGSGASVDMVRILLVQGVDPQARNDQGQTALDLARHWNRAAAIKILQQYGD